LAVGSTCYPHEEVHTDVRLYRWTGFGWSLNGLVTGPLGPSQWISPASLTGSRDPDFAIAGCGAGDTNCLSIVSNLGGRWHAVPFEYGYGRALEVNGTTAGHLVLTEVNACSCAGGPSTWMYERYREGVFQPTDPPGHASVCSPSQLANVADPWQIKVLHFDRVACAAGWALAVGTGAGFGGRVVGLFDRGSRGARWHVLTLDNGNALPAAPAIYDLPLSLFIRLASRLGSPIARHISAARLIARLQSQDHFDWPLQNGIVRVGGTDWLIAVVPAGRAPNEYSPYPVAAEIYRWGERRWVLRGRVRRLPKGLNLAWNGGWFVSTVTERQGVAFALAGSYSHDKSLITNAGGRWHVAKR
jgi:hypothetical protein